MIHHIITRLKATTDVTDITTEDRIFPLIRLQGSQVPALVVQLVGGTPTEAKDETSQVDDNLVEITAFATDPSTAWTLSEAVRSSIDGYTSGSLAEVRFQNHASDIFESTDTFSITARYLVRHSRDNTQLVTSQAGLGYDVTFRGQTAYKVRGLSGTAGQTTKLKAGGSETIIFIDASVGGGNGTHNLYLPPVAESEGRVLRITTGGNVSQQRSVTINPEVADSSATIDGAATHELRRAYDGVMLLGYLGNWYIIQRKSKS
jgi:hypothetical protein